MCIFTSISDNITLVFFKNMAQNTKLKTRGLILTLILNDVFFSSLFSFTKVAEKESFKKIVKDIHDKVIYQEFNLNAVKSS